MESHPIQRTANASPAHAVEDMRIDHYRFEKLRDLAALFCFQGRQTAESCNYKKNFPPDQFVTTSFSRSRLSKINVPNGIIDATNAYSENMTDHRCLKYKTANRPT